MQEVAGAQVTAGALTQGKPREGAAFPVQVMSLSNERKDVPPKGKEARESLQKRRGAQLLGGQKE